MKTYKKGISLIVLVITIIVLAILAATVIIQLSNTNIIENASETRFKSDMASYKEAFELYVASELMEDRTFDRTTLNVTSSDAEFTEIFGNNVSDNYKEKLQVVKGKLAYETNNSDEQEILQGLSIEVILPAGLYQSGTLVKTWDELMSETSCIYVSGGYLSGTFESDPTVDYFVHPDSSILNGDLVISDYVTTIGSYIFSNCYRLTSVSLSHNATDIGSYTFYGCSGLTTVNIPNSITSIYNSAFEDCNNLVNINYNGTVEEWNSVTKDDGWDRGTGVYKIYCTDGTIAKDGTVTYY